MLPKFGGCCWRHMGSKTVAARGTRGRPGPGRGLTAAAPKRIGFFLLQGRGCRFQPLSSAILKALHGPHDHESRHTSQRPPVKRRTR